MNETLRLKIEHANKSLQGWCSTKKALALASLIEVHRPRFVVEVGVFGGRSLIPMAQAMAFHLIKGIVIGVDPWTKQAALEGGNSKANDEWWSSVDLNAIMAGCQEAINDLELFHVCVLARCNSTEFSIGQNIDILHLDSNHSEECSMRDLRHFIPQIKPHGILVMDDTLWSSMQKGLDHVRHSFDHLDTIETGTREAGDIQQSMVFRKR